MICALCSEPKLEHQVAHHTCKDCGQSLAHCFVCNYQAYKHVDAFRTNHQTCGKWPGAIDVQSALAPWEPMP